LLKKKKWKSNYLGIKLTLLKKLRLTTLSKYQVKICKTPKRMRRNSGINSTKNKIILKKKRPF